MSRPIDCLLDFFEDPVSWTRASQSGTLDPPCGGLAARGLSSLSKSAQASGIAEAHSYHQAQGPDWECARPPTSPRKPRSYVSSSQAVLAYRNVAKKQRFGARWYWPILTPKWPVFNVRAALPPQTWAASEGGLFL